MSSKTKEGPIVYPFVIYNGIIIRGCTFVSVSSTHPEAELNGEIIFDSYKKYYGDDIKGRYVKSKKTFEEIVQGLTDKLEKDIIYSKDNIFLCRKNVTDIVKIIKEISGANKCSFLGCQNEEDEEKTEITSKKTATKSTKKNSTTEVEDELDEEPKTKKTTTKKTTQKKTVTKEPEHEEDEEKDEEKTVKKVASKTTKTATKTKTEKIEQEEEEEEEVELKPAKKVSTKTTTKPATKTPTKKVKSELDDDLEEDIVVQTKGKTQAKGGSKTQIIVSDSDEEQGDEEVAN